MAAKRTGLGRGIGALIPTAEATMERPVDVFFPGAATRTTATIAKPQDEALAPAPAEDETPDLVEVPGARLVRIDPHRIVPNPRQPRTDFDPDDLAELVHSVREFGVLEPVVVRQNGNGDYELIMGERRTRAAREAGLESIPAIVRDTADEHLLRDALLENLHRSELNALEEASAYQQLPRGLRHHPGGAGLAHRPFASPDQQHDPAARVPVPVQQRVAAGVLTPGHARAILSLDDVEAMQRLADKIVNEDLSVRAAEAAAKAKDAAGTRSLPPKAGARQAYLNEVADRLGDRLNTKVRVALGARKGQITVDFATIQDLNRILAELGESTYGA
ncbi:ParB/RepB/Spo0J family partition protein [Microbacterium elymi]|uniref:ParB/RepB/Spo0J family partition protein n=1 Tax=Microbacterium elymi TaxID=2909587 RepID=A0ABY5NGJ2_9MICO|nr:ParB/RepB/Spo0J family partition protein [Microbacterium elymi]UUT34333.1 ParB/RepB/Spo0J family partition protein [Microbacterium elymi]